MESEVDSKFSDRPPLDCMWRKGNCWMTRMLLSPTRIRLPLKSRHIERLYMRGICSYMGSSHIPDIDTSTNSAEDNPFVGPKTQVPGKVSAQMPVDDWLCKKLNKLNIILVEGYPSQSSEAGGLLKDQRSPKSSGTGCILTTRLTLLLCQPGILMRHTSTVVITGLPDRPVCHLSHLLHVTFPKKTYVSGRSRLEMLLLCVIRPRVLTGACEVKAKARVFQRSQLPLVNCNTLWILTHPSSGKNHGAPHRLCFCFNENLTLARRDSYLTHVKTGIKPDTLAALRTAPLQVGTLFPDSILKNTEDDIAHFESKGQSTSSHSKGQYHSYERFDKIKGWRNL